MMQETEYFPISCNPKQGFFRLLENAGETKGYNPYNLSRSLLLFDFILALEDPEACTPGKDDATRISEVLTSIEEGNWNPARHYFNALSREFESHQGDELFLGYARTLRSLTRTFPRNLIHVSG